MTMLPDHEIRIRKFIHPIDKGEHKPGRISSGITSYGYDVRLGTKFKIFSPIHASEVDPKNFDSKLLEEIDLTCAQCNNVGHYTKYEEGSKTIKFCGCTKKNEFVRIPPHSFALAESYETFSIPRDILGICLGKSTYARCGLIIPMTPLEPMWIGKITLELANITPLPIRVYPMEGIAQVVFLRANPGFECQTSYADKRGGYQDQAGLTPPKVRKD